MNATDAILTWCAVIGLSVGVARGADAPQYPEAHPPVGEQPKRPAGYVPYQYPKTAEQLWHDETPALLEKSHAAWEQAEATIDKGPFKADHESIGTHACPEWFSDAKFGMFIDWGPWSVAGWAPQAKLATYPDWYERRLFKEYRDYHLKAWGEDIRPDDLIQLLRPDEFHPEGFTTLAKAAGMRYVVPFLKHHGGYCLWNSSFTHRNSVEWGLRRDFAKELSAACQGAGLRYGAYVSLGEWNYPIIKDGGLYTSGLDVWTTHSQKPPEKVTAETPFISGKIPVNDYTREYLVPSLKELIDNTNPDMLWFDGEWGAAPTVWCAPEISAYFYDRAATRGQEVCINDRMGKDTRGKPGWGDFYTSEFHVIKGFQSHPWEENRSLSHSYGYNWEESFDDRYVLGEAESLDMLLRVVANGGNLLLMVSPDGSGRVPPNQEKRLRFIGNWLDRNGQAIYATRPVGLKEQPAWGYVTRSKKSDHLYLIVRHWPQDGMLHVPVVVKTGAARLIGAEAKPEITDDQSGLTVKLADIKPPDPNASVIEVDVEGEITPVAEKTENPAH